MRVSVNLFYALLSAGTLGAMACTFQIAAGQSAPPIPQPPAVTYANQLPTFGAGHDYIQMLAETVNPANGSVSLRIPITVPKGRGLTSGMSIGYDSASVNTVAPEGTPGLNSVQTVIQIATSDSNVQIAGGVKALGWTVLTPSLTASSSSWTNYDGQETCSYTQDYVFTDIQGQRHAFPDLTFDDSSGNESIRCPPITAPHVSVSMDGAVQAIIAGGTTSTTVV